MSTLGFIAGEAPDGLVLYNGAPAVRTIDVFDRATSTHVASTVSASDGTYRIDGLDATKAYDVIARGQDASENDLIVARVMPLALITIDGNVPVAQPNVAFSCDLTINGGTGPYTLQMSGNPAWLSGAISGSTLTLSGTPTTAAAPVAVTLLVTDTNEAYVSRTVSVSVGISARFWRLYVTASEASGTSAGYMNLDLIALQTSSGGVNQCVGSGGTATQSSILQGVYTAQHAFENPNLDGTTDGTGFYWHSSDQVPPWWASYDFGAGHSVVVAYVTIASTNIKTRAPKDFQIQYSSDGTTWTTAATYSGETGWATDSVRTYAVPNP